MLETNWLKIQWTGEREVIGNSDGVFSDRVGKQKECTWSANGLVAALVLVNR